MPALRSNIKGKGGYRPATPFGIRRSVSFAPPPLGYSGYKRRKAAYKKSSKSGRSFKNYRFATARRIVRRLPTDLKSYVRSYVR